MKHTPALDSAKLGTDIDLAAVPKNRKAPKPNPADKLVEGLDIGMARPVHFKKGTDAKTLNLGRIALLAAAKRLYPFSDIKMTVDAVDSVIYVCRVERPDPANVNVDPDSLIGF